MALKLSVKIGDVTNLSDARYAAGMGVDYIGFNINTASENFVTPKTFTEIVNWISGIDIIGEVGKNTPNNLEEYPAFLTETTNPVNLKNSEDIIFRIDAKGLSAQEIKLAFTVTQNPLFWIVETTPEQLNNESAFFTDLCASHPIYIATTFNESILEKVINTIKPKGIEIKGGLEDQPGFKDYEGIADVLEWLEED